MGFSDLISDIKLLRHNLTVYSNIDNGYTKDQYIFRFTNHEKEAHLISGVSAPSKDELHEHYKSVTEKLCNTPHGLKLFKKFLKGDDSLFYSMSFNKDFGFLSTKNNLNSSIYSSGLKNNNCEELERIARNLPLYLVKKKAPIYAGDLTEENLPRLTQNLPSKPLPLLIKNEPENP